MIEDDVSFDEFNPAQLRLLTQETLEALEKLELSQINSKLKRIQAACMNAAERGDTSYVFDTWEISSSETVLNLIADRLRSRGFVVTVTENQNILYRCLSVSWE